MRHFDLLEKMKLTLIQIKLGVTVVQASLYSMGIMNLTPWEALEDLKAATHARFLTDDEINEDHAVSTLIGISIHSNPAQDPSTIRRLGRDKFQIQGRGDQHPNEKSRHL